MPATAHTALKVVCRVIVAAVVCTALPAGAQAPTDTNRIEQRLLSEDEVRRFVASYPEVEAFGRDFDRDWTGGVDTMPLALSAEALGTADGIVRRHGFADFSEWVAVAQSATIAYGFVQSGRSMEEIRAEAEAALRQMEAAAGLTGAQKQEMAAMMSESMAAMERIQPPAENVELVRAMQDALEPIMQSD